MSRLRLTPITRPLISSHCSPRPLLSFAPIQHHHRRYAGSSYGGGEGDPKGENPSDQGSNPSADLEHPGPPPPAAGQGTGGGPTKKGAGGHNTPESNDTSGNEGGGGGGKADGPQPKIHKHSAPEEHTHSDEVRAHNEDMSKRHDRPTESSGDKDDKVDKKFWKGQGGADNDP